MTVMNNEDPAAPDEVDEAEAVIACLGDDAAKLREANSECEIAANMEVAADMLERLRGERLARGGLPSEDALRRAYYYTELGGWRGPEVDEFERWHSVAQVSAREAEPLLRDALRALAYYREQTRPIADCDAVIARLRARLGA